MSVDNLKYIHFLCCVAQPIVRRAVLPCLLYLGLDYRRLPRRRLPGRPHISMDTSPMHSGYCKVSTTRRLLTNVLKI